MPPSSKSTGFSVSDAARITARPAGTLPTRATMAIPGCAARCAAASRPPGSTLNTPAGNRSWVSSAMRRVVSGACSGGLITTALPAARMAAVLPAQNIRGWLKGRMRPITPRGSRTEKFTTSGPMGIEAPFISVTRPAKNSICWAPASASPIISE